MEFYFTGSIERVIFENPSNFFRILLLDISDTDAKDYDDFEIIVTGTMADVLEGESYTFWGELVQHPKYGQQLKISRYEKEKPSSQGLIKYFSSDHFKGIGLKTAQKIIELYGEDDTINQILFDPKKLEGIANLSRSNRENFVRVLQLNYGTELVLSKLASYGISNHLAFQIQDFYKEETLDIVQSNPYQLVEDIRGLGFKIADQIAQGLGIKATAPARFRAGLIHSLFTISMETGDTYVEAKDLLKYSLNLLEAARPVELDPSELAKELSQLIQEDRIQHIDTKIFDNSLFFAEEGIKTQFQRILEKGYQKTFPIETILSSIHQVEKELGIRYDTIQKEAICQAINNKVFILTGGPGTGKTTVLNGFIAVYADLHDINLSQKSDLPILLAAPTGRASRRMNELTGLPSATIHRHLGMTGDDATSSLTDYLDADLIIIDEFSMVDTWLANQLLQHISSNSQLVIVGDKDQLPSVSPGQVLADLLEVSSLAQIELKKIYRQSQDSTIVMLASQIKEGQLPVDFTQKKPDRSYFEAQSEHIPQMVEKIVSAAIRSGLNAQDIQVLAPMYRGQAGIDHINQLMQNLLNPACKDQLSFETIEGIYRKGDKVIHLINDAESNVFNGDLGYITDLVPAKYTESKQDELTINFEGNDITYPRNEWYKIRLAYAMSIHKSQGSEFPVVILPITSSSRRMLKRNLIYTAITRAKSKLILLGEYQAFEFATLHTGTARKTYLIERFENSQASLSTDPTVLSTDSVDKTVPKSATSVGNSQLFVDKPVNNYILTEENWQDIDPMIGLLKEEILSIFQ